MKYSLLLIILMMLHSQHDTIAQRFIPPPTPSVPVADTVHGKILTDNYRWLEDKQDEKVKEWTHNQHNATLKLSEIFTGNRRIRTRNTLLFATRHYRQPVFCCRQTILLQESKECRTIFINAKGERWYRTCLI